MPPSSDFSLQRRRMVRLQLHARGITHPLVLRAFRTIPREKFVPRHLRSSAYADRPLSIGHGQTISQPYVVALMAQLLLSHPHFSPSTSPVLEIGTGSGYQTAILAQIFRTVYTVERLSALAKSARARLNRLKISNFHLRVGDGYAGWPRWKTVTHSRGFPAVIVSAAAPHVPPALKTQLANHGRLIIPVGSTWDQTLLRITHTGNHFTTKDFGPVSFVELVNITQ
jgi:protein-L-isoaspartate(D-aspartate) O-methyltransferase